MVQQPFDSGVEGIVVLLGRLRPDPRTGTLDAVCVRVADMPKRQNASHVSPRQPA